MKHHPKVKKVLIPVLIGSIIGLFIVSALFSLKVYFNGHIPGEVNIAGIDVSYDNPISAHEKLQDAVTTYLNQPVGISIEGTSKEISLTNLGVEILVPESIKMIDKIDSFNVSTIRFLEDLLIPLQKNLTLLVKIDEKKLTATIDKEFNLTAPISAKFYINQNKTLLIEPETKGLYFNKKMLIKDLKHRSKTLDNEDFEISLGEALPDILSADLEKQKPQVSQILTHKLVLIDPVYSDDWTITLADQKDWVVFNTTAESTTIEINQEKLNEFVDVEIAKWLDKPVTNVTMSKKGEEVIIEGDGHDGRLIQREALKRSIELAAVAKIKNVPIPTKKIVPELKISEELQKLGIKERIGVGHTSFYGSPVNRVFNINVATNKLNGKLIAPGEVFSFNKTIGNVDGSTGYRKELVIKKEGTLPEYGGGVCQVSTTMYRAALFTGLPITERNQHSYAVSYYSQIMGHGLDATIYIGGPDLKFQNDTENHLLVQAYTKNEYELYFIFYGTSDGRSVQMEGPYLSNYRNPGPTQTIETNDLAPGQRKQVEKSHTGFDALWYRYVTKANGEVIKETIATKYKAIPAKVLVGAATSVPVQ